MKSSLRSIVINGRFLSKPITGVERYAHEMTRAIGELVCNGAPEADGLDIVIARPQIEDPLPFSSNLEQVFVGSGPGQVWEQVTLPRFAKDAIVLNFCNVSPLFHANSITCVHDAHPWLIPENFSWKFRKWYDIIVPLSIRRSKRWTTVSRYSGEQLVKLNIAHRPPDAITYNASDTFKQSARPELAQSVIAKFGLQKDYVLCLGSSSKNKNIALINGIAGQLLDMGISVIVAGGSKSSVFGEEGHQANNVTQVGRVTDDELKVLYANALAFVFPSFFEGFGVPPIEAMSQNCPVIASNSSALPEVLGSAAILASPEDPQAWLAAISQLKNTPELRAELIGKGRQKVGEYGWAKSAAKVLGLAQELVGQ